jgi:hypothetical protein
MWSAAAKSGIHETGTALDSLPGGERTDGKVLRRRVDVAQSASSEWA